jgi:glycosyltransferase involved in cell wall biosynthesis
VSVWCDQLVRGLPDKTFRVVALTAFSYQRPVWDLPDHVDDLVTVGLWDHRRHRAGPRARWRRRRRGTPAPLAAGLAALLTSPRAEVAWFSSFLDALSGLDEVDIAKQLCFGELLTALDVEVSNARTWEAVRSARASDLVRVADMLDHLLRPLAVDAGPAAVYHASSNGLAALVCMVAQRRHGARFLLTEHGIYLRERYLELRRLPLARPARALLLRFHRLVSGAAYTRASLVVPGSRWNLRWETRHGAPEDQVRTIYNGIEPDEFPARVEEPDQPVVAWLGRIDPIKDLETLVSSFAVVHEHCPDAVLRVYGRTPPGGEAYVVKLNRLIAELGLESTVIFAGGVVESADAFRDAQVGVLSSISEGFPYSLIEAMASGVPAVATGVGGVDEAVADTGLVVPPRAPELLGEAIVELLNDTPRRQKMGVMARERVLERFTVQHCIDGYRATYAEVCRTYRVAQLQLVPDPEADERRDELAPEARGGPRASGASSGQHDERDEREELVSAIGGAEALAQTVDADEVAATLESVGVTDQVAVTRFGARNVFELAEGVWRAGGGSSDPPRPTVPPSPQPTGSLGRGLAYVLPAIVVAAAVLTGADQIAVVAASVVAWGIGQAGGVLAYTALHRSPSSAGLAPLRRGIVAALVFAGVVGTGIAWLRPSGWVGGVAASLPILHLVGATGLVVLGRTRALLRVLAPVSVVSALVVLAPHSPLGALVGPVSVVTVAGSVGWVTWLAWCSSFRFRWRSGTAPARGHVLERADWVGAAPLALCGWCTAGFALLLVTVVSHLSGLTSVDSRQWLVLGLPLWTMVGAGEWFFLTTRRALAIELEASADIATFRLAAMKRLVTSGGAAAMVLGVVVVVATIAAAALSGLSPTVGLSAASVFGLLAMALYGATVLTAASHSLTVLLVTAAAVVLLGWVAFATHNPLGVEDHKAALLVGTAVAAALCLGAGRVLSDPASHR